MVTESKRRFCHWSDDGCERSRWVGGNYGSPVCDVDEHHADPCPDCGQLLQRTGNHPVLGLTWACANPKCDSLFKVKSQ